MAKEVKSKINVQEISGDADMLMRKHKYHQAIPMYSKVLSEQAHNERVLLKVEHIIHI